MCGEPTGNGETAFSSRHVWFTPGISDKDNVLFLKPALSSPYPQGSSYLSLCVPITALSALCALSHCSLIATLWGKYCRTLNWQRMKWKQRSWATCHSHTKWQDLKDFELRQSRVKYIQSQAVATNRLAMSSVTQVPNNTSHSVGDVISSSSLKDLKGKITLLGGAQWKENGRVYYWYSKLFFPDYDEYLNTFSGIQMNWKPLRGLGTISNVGTGVWGMCLKQIFLNFRAVPVKKIFWLYWIITASEEFGKRRSQSTEKLSRAKKY